MTKQKSWDIYEAAILLDAVIKVHSGEIDRKRAIVDVSLKLRKMATIAGENIDDIYRNVAGITFQMHSMESAYFGYTLVKPATKLFLNTVKIMQENRKKYEDILHEAMNMTKNNRPSKENFFKWLSEKMTSMQLSELIDLYSRIDNDLILQNILERPLLETTDEKILNDIKNTIQNNAIFRFNNRRYIHKMSTAIIFYAEYIEKEAWKEGKKNLVDDMQESLKLQEPAESNLHQDVGFSFNREEKKKAFSDWLVNNGMAFSTARVYASSVGLIGEIAQKHGLMSINVYETSDTELLISVLRQLVTIPEFIKKNETRHNQFRASWIKYINYCGVPSFRLEDVFIQRSTDSDVIMKDNPILYRRLKSLASVYDDVDGYSTQWIREKIGICISESELEHALDELSWVTKVQDGVYSFSKNAKRKIDFDKDSFVKVLMMRYKNGMQLDSIDLENFRETYQDITDEEIPFSDKDLIACLLKCGVSYKGRVFPAEGVVSNDIKTKLMEYIEKSFADGKQVLYFKAIFSDLSDVLRYCYNLTDEMMLKAYLEYECASDVYYFSDDYITKEKNVRVNHSAEVEEYIFSMGRPLSYDEIYAGLSHLSQDIIYNEIKTNSNIILNEKGHYFHINIFEFSSEDADAISDYINYDIEADGYCIWSRVFKIIKTNMPLFIEKNIYLSSLGIRNAVAKKLSVRFNFDREVICGCDKILKMADVYRLYGENHTPFSDDDIYTFSKEVSGGVIYFESLSEAAIRVSKKQFVSKKDINFDVEATDYALSTYLHSGYMLVRDFDSFLLFPNIGYEWNVFLLESYLMYYSKKYGLSNNGRSLNNVAGAVVKKGSGYDNFADVCADVLAKSNCSLTKNKALDYLGDLNLLTRRSYSKIDLAITKAKQLRNKRDSK